MKTLVVGLGNPILGDDGVGWRVVEEVRRRISDLQSSSVEKRLGIGDCEIDCAALGGLSLMERLIGCERAIVIDAIGTGQKPIGAVYHFRLDDLYDPTSGHTTAAHDVSLMTAMQIGRSLGAPLPDRVDVVAIESPYVYDFSEDLTPPVGAAVPRAAELVMTLLQHPEWNEVESKDAFFDCVALRSERYSC